jgi:pectin methylesterase-like acyl-CoA thioesterase
MDASTGTGGRGGAGGMTGVGGTTRPDAGTDAAVVRDSASDPPPQTNLPAGVSALFPAPGAQGICPDPPLRITFPKPPTLGAKGKIQVFNSSGTAVATVDMAASTITDSIGGSTFAVLRPVYVDGNDAVVYLKQKALAYGQTYHVNVEAGAIVPPSGSFAISDSTTWRFTTAAAKPSDVSKLAVALDGSGQLCSVQGAFDALPSNNTVASTITVAPGTYHEIVYVSGKSNVTLRGQDRKTTIIASTNNSTQQGSNASTSNRALMGFRNTNGLTIENLTIHNLTPQGGSQAEALAMQGCDKCVVRDADILSLQDTLLWSGRIYAKNCFIAGNVDFVWGTGAAYFDSCEIRTVGRSGYVVQARNPSSAYGYVFVDSKITADSGVTGIVLARIDSSVYPASHVAYINCQMGSYIAPAGWTVTGGGTSQLRFWEYQSVDSAGKAIDVSQRTGGIQISASQAASMRDPSVVLAGWTPPP